MRFEIDFEQIYPYPVETVWTALTEGEALSTWLNEMVDFRPLAGQRFEMRCVLDDGSVDVYHCQVLEVEARRLMAWSWLLEGAQSGEPTRVEFRLEPVDGGTRLRVQHSGDRDPGTVSRLRSGWPAKLADLAAMLAGSLQG